MDNKKRMLEGKIYDCGDPSIAEEQTKTWDLMFEYNHTLPSQLEKRRELLGKMLGKCGKNCYIEAPFYANFGGRHLFVGDYFYANFHLTAVDDGNIYIGDHVMIAPNVTLATATHPILSELRVKNYQFNKDIHIGNTVWIGAGVIVLPGVTIGDDTVIGAGSVVTKDIPSGVVAFGNPCRVMRKVNEHDREYFYKQEKIDWENLD